MCERSLSDLGIEALDVFCLSRVDPSVPIAESVGAMARLVEAAPGGSSRGRLSRQRP